MSIREQPLRGRKVGFTAFRSYLAPALIIEYSGSENSVCILSLDQDEYLKRNDTVFEILIGTKAQSPKILYDPIDGEQKLFFVFNDLSFRVQGEFIIHCNIIDLDTMRNYRISTKPVVVVTPQDFAGIPEPSMLAKSFSLQGVKIAGRRC